MTEEDDYEYYRRMFWSSIVWSVVIVVLMALIAWLL